MVNELSAPAALAPSALKSDEVLIDRAFAAQMARVPLLAVAWVAASVAAHYLWAAVAPADAINYGPVAVICVGMLLAAVIDGWAYKVPNWVTLPLVVSGWMIGLLHDLGAPVDSGTGGLGAALLGTLMGFALLFPILAIGGVGAGDVKMQMGFGAWVAAYFGTGEGTATGLGWSNVLLWSFCFGAIAGGAFALVMIFARRQFTQNVAMVGEIFTDLQMILAGQGAQASKRANDRRSKWVKLPYGIPLCVGFLGFLWYALAVAG